MIPGGSLFGTIFERSDSMRIKLPGTVRRLRPYTSDQILSPDSKALWPHVPAQLPLHNRRVDGLDFSDETTDFATISVPAW